MNNMSNGESYLKRRRFEPSGLLFITCLVLPFISFFIVLIFPEIVDLFFKRAIVCVAKALNLMDKEIIMFP